MKPNIEASSFLWPNTCQDKPETKSRRLAKAPRANANFDKNLMETISAGPSGIGRRPRMHSLSMSSASAKSIIQNMPSDPVQNDDVFILVKTFIDFPIADISPLGNDSPPRFYLFFLSSLKLRDVLSLNCCRIKAPVRRLECK